MLYTALLILSFIMFLPPIDIIKNYNFFVKNIFYSNRTTGSLSNSVKVDVTKNIDFIERNTTEGEQILILSYNYDGIYYGESKTQMVVGVVSPSDTFFRYQYSDLMNFVEVNKNIKIFVSPEYEDYKILEILNDTYQKKVDNFGMILYAK